MRADLHSHSTASDGLASPARLVELAAELGLTHLALTDHDTTSGLAAAREQGGRSGVSVVDGIEITTELNGRELHLVGLLIDPEAPPMVAFVARAGAERASRMERMVEALSRSGVGVRMEDVLAEAAGATLARPHLARALVRSGAATSFNDAFDRFLGPGRPGHVLRWKPSVGEVVSLVRAAGGTTSVAHPGVDRVSRRELEDLAAAGVDAVEARHPEHPPTQVAAYERWAAALGLAVTGGSDFHGADRTPERSPGCSLTPAGMLERLAATAAGRARAGS